MRSRRYISGESQNGETGAAGEGRRGETGVRTALDRDRAAEGEGKGVAQGRDAQLGQTGGNQEEGE